MPLNKQTNRNTMHLSIYLSIYLWFLLKSSQILSLSVALRSLLFNKLPLAIQKLLQIVSQCFNPIGKNSKSSIYLMHIYIYIYIYILRGSQREIYRLRFYIYSHVSVLWNLIINNILFNLSIYLSSTLWSD